MREFGFAENVRHLGSRMRRIGLGPAEKKVGSASSSRSHTHCCSSQLGLKLCSSWYLLNRTPFSEGKSHLKSNYYCEAVPVVLSKKPEFSCFFSSTLIGKNNYIRVERHKLLLSISKEQAKRKDHYCIN